MEKETQERKHIVAVSYLCLVVTSIMLLLVGGPRLADRNAASRGFSIGTSTGFAWANDGSRSAGKDVSERRGTKLRSREARTKTEITFENRRSGSVAVYWIDYEGREVLYRELRFQESYRQSTFVSHPWAIRTGIGGNLLGAVVATNERRLVRIEQGGIRLTVQSAPRRPSGNSGTLRSLEGRTSTAIVFENRLNEAVVVYWLNYQGKEVRYRDLAPGESYRQSTYVTHPWKVRTKKGSRVIGSVVADREERIVRAGSGGLQISLVAPHGDLSAWDVAFGLAGAGVVLSILVWFVLWLSGNRGQTAGSTGSGHSGSYSSEAANPDGETRHREVEASPGRPGWVGAWSQSAEGSFGGKYVQHYDEGSGKVGYSQKEMRLLGGTYEQHYGQDGEKRGYSEKETGVFGGEYTQHYEEDGSKSGCSQPETGVFSGEYVQHYDEDGGKSGYSEKTTDFWGNEYWQHYNQDGTKRDE